MYRGRSCGSWLSICTHRHCKINKHCGDASTCVCVSLQMSCTHMNFPIYIGRANTRT